MQMDLDNLHIFSHGNIVLKYTKIYNLNIDIFMKLLIL